MRIISFIMVAVVFTTLLAGCDKIRCKDIDCFAPPEPLVFDIRDSINGNNVFASGLYSTDQIEVRDENDLPEQWIFDSYFDTNYIVLPAIGWETERLTYRIILADTVSIQFVLDMDERHENCCTFFARKEFDVTSHGFQVADTTGIIQVNLK
ncbi:MAG: hypothetical protein EOM83_08600 [Clostridia bacterium]|nr:hypothetical protein [Clostridia bacterium]